MGTVVAFHAHPDDESLIMGGSLARASARGTPGRTRLLPLMAITDKFLTTLRQERR